MDISSVNSDLIRGNVTTIILGSLWNRDRYGYDILKEIETKSEGQYKLKQPTLYNQLKRLEKQGLISSYDGDPDDTGGGRRRYYSLTAEGRSFLEKERSEYEYSRTILDKLVSARQFDFDTTPAPFNTDDLRPYTKKDNSDKAKVVYREKEKVVLVEKKIYIDAEGNEITEEEAQRLAAEGGKQAVGISQEEFDRIQAEKQSEIERIEAEKREELERIEEEKKAELERAEEAKREEIERLAAEAQAERERLEAEHAEEVERLRAEKLAAEEAYAAREAEYSARRIEELERIAAERDEAERRFREEYEKFEEEKRAEEERRLEAERIETERREELERIEAERIAAEERFAKEREEFLAEKAEEEARRAEYERIEAEKREKAEREAREREEALRSQATMSLDDVFRELDSKSEYVKPAEAEDLLIVEDAKWHIEEPLPAEVVEEEKEKAEEEAPEQLPEEEAAVEKEEEPEEVPAPAEEETAKEEEKETASLEEIFRTLDAKSEYSAEKSSEEEYDIAEAEWHTPAPVREEEPSPSLQEEAAETPTEEPQAPAAEVNEEAERVENDRLAELARLEAERKAELERIARELEAVKAKLDAAPTYVYATERPVERTRETIFDRIDRQTRREEERAREEARTEQTQEVNYFSADGAYGSRKAPESTLSDVFRMLDEKEAEIDSRNETDGEETPEYRDAAADYAETSAPAAPATPVDEEEKGEFVVSAVRGKRTEAFDYEKDNVNYREFFSSIANTQEEKTAEPPAERTLPRPETDLKTRLYSEGFKMRPYDRGNTSEYYTFNFINANRLNRDSWLVVLAIYLVETAIMWACLASSISYVYFLPFMLGGAALMLIPTVIWMINPSRRKRADFNVKLSVLNRGMLMIELAVVLVLIAFFGVGVSVNDTTLILETMVLPIVLLTNLPISSLVYWLLYRSKKYHTA